jgi:hypothetical protein
MMDYGYVLRPAVRRTTGMLVLLAALLLGLGWLTYEVSRGLQNGRESDLHRRWVVAQYVRAGVNPYPLALAALHHTYGRLGDDRPKPRVYAVPRLSVDDPAASPSARPLLTVHRTPEAVYPPSADLLLALTVGKLPEGRVHLAGVVVNVALLVACTLLLCRLPAGSATYSPLGVLTAAALVLTWSPTQSALEAGQFSILVTVCLLLAFRCLDRHEYIAGAWFALALIKPSMTLPFLILPLVRGRWRALAVAAGLHLAATVVQALRFGVFPLELLRQWTQVAAYFTQGQFTLQEILSSLRLADTPAGFAVVAGFVLFAIAWCVINRTASDASLIDFLCFASLLWTYHGPYDFVILLVPIARRLVPPAETVRRRWWQAAVPAVALFVFVSAAASSPVYGDEVHLAARLVRHAARLLLGFGFLLMVVDVWRSTRMSDVVVPELSDSAPAVQLLRQEGAVRASKYGVTYADNRA